MQSGNPSQPPVASQVPYPSAVPVQYPPAAVPAHTILQGKGKRPLNSAEEAGDPHWKRVRFEDVSAQASGGTATQSAAGGGMQGSNATAGSKVPHSNAGVQRPAPDPSPEDYPVVEAMVRREGTDKFRRVQVDGQLNAVERAEVVLVCIPPKKMPCPIHVSLSHCSMGLCTQQNPNMMQFAQGTLCLVSAAHNTGALAHGLRYPSITSALAGHVSVLVTLLHRQAALNLNTFQDERKKICPKSAVDQVLAGLGADEDFAVEDDVKSALGMLAENMLEETMEFAALMASRRNSKWVQVRLPPLA